MQLNPVNFYRNQTIVDTNVLKQNTVGDADIYCFCEWHHRADHMVKIGKSIGEMYKEGDVILVEGAQGPTSVNEKRRVLKEYPGIPKEAVIEGWDLDEDKCFKVLDKFTTFSKEMLPLKNTSFTKETYKPTFKRIVDLTKIELTPQELAYLNTPNNNQDKTLEKQILVKVYDKLCADFTTAVSAGMVTRNQQMSKSIMANKKAGNKIFIICGAAHAALDKTGGTNERFAIEVMRFVLEKFRYVILQPDDKPVIKPLKEKKVEIIKEAESPLSKFFHKIVSIIAYPINYIYNHIPAIWKKAVEEKGEKIDINQKSTHWDIADTINKAKDLANNWDKE